MKDIETIIPFLREFFNERGLKDVNICLTLSDLPLNVVNETHSETPTKEAGSQSLGDAVMKIHPTGKDDLVLFSKYF